MKLTYEEFYELSHAFWRLNSILDDREKEVVDRILRGQTYRFIGKYLHKYSAQRKKTNIVGITGTAVRFIFIRAFWKLMKKERILKAKKNWMHK